MALRSDLAQPERRGNGERILVVDDSRETVRHLAEHLLPNFGFVSTYALDGRTALEKIRRERPDLVMLDLNLPQMTGLDVLHELAADAYRPPVVLMTGGGSEQSAVEAFRLGVKDYLVKPFTLEEVIETIQRALAGRQREADPLSAADVTVDVLQSELRRRRAQLRRLLDIGRAITTPTDIQTIVERTLRAAIEECRAESGALWLAPSGEGPLLAYQFDAESGTLQPLREKGENPFVRRVLDLDEALCLADFSDGLAVGGGQRVRALLYTPLRLRNLVTGVLGVGNLRAPHAFGEEDALVLRAIADHAGLALAHVHALQQARTQQTNRVRDLYNLTELTTTLATHSAEKAIHDALAYVYRRWRIDACSLWAVDRARRRVRFVDHVGIGSPSLAQAAVPLGKGFVGYAAETGKWIYSNAVGDHPRHFSGVDQSGGFQTHSLLCVPAVYRGQVLGALELINRQDGEFDERDVDPAAAVAAVLALALRTVSDKGVSS